MRETDISKFTMHGTEQADSPKIAIRILKTVGRALLTFAVIGLCVSIIIGISLVVYIMGIINEPTGINLKARSQKLTSFIYVKQENGKFTKYKSLYDTENRDWVEYEKIPQNMKDAVVAIEDRRFRDHHGVDWMRTGGAILSLAGGKDSYGGSTLTQQLIKNISDDNEVSLNRKIREIVRAIKLENEYTKDQILEAYLNVVNFGNNCQGVQVAANLYFGKKIEKCSLAQCAAIAGITQNPSRYNPLEYPEENRERRELVLHEMLDQGKITKSEYNEAMKESATMKFVGFKKNKSVTVNNNVQNWYMDELQNDLCRDLAVYYNISEKAASDKLFTEGLKIYSAMDVDTQEYLEKAAMNIDTSEDSGLQCAATIIDMNGAIIATTGSSQEKTQNLLFDRATDSVLQPGSSIKPVVVYPYAIEKGKLNYSSVVKDKPLEKYKVDSEGNYVEGPKNWYDGYKGNMLLPDAIEWSANAPAAQVLDMISPSAAYNQVVTLQGFEHLKEQDRYNSGGLSIGGLTGGVTVREMAATFTYMGNGGRYYKPYTYYYVTDNEGNIILDNRDASPKQSYSPETAYIMNRLLHYNIKNCAHTNAYLARVDGWDICGKTGTTDEDKDSWFCGISPYASMAVWTGFDTPRTISVNGQQTATKLFSDVMGHYLENKTPKKYTKPSSIKLANYNPSNGTAYNVGEASEDDEYVGYYTEDNLPEDGSEYVDDYDGSDYDEEAEEATEKPTTDPEDDEGDDDDDSETPTTPPAEETTPAEEEPQVPDPSPDDSGQGGDDEASDDNQGGEGENSQEGD